jgi:hypothetical protein
MKTSNGDATLLTMAWQIVVRLFNSILSKPIKADWETTKMAPESIVMDVTAIRGADSGLLKSVVAT